MPRNNRKECIIERVRQIVGDLPEEFIASEIQTRYNRDMTFTLSVREIVGILRGHGMAEKIPNRLRERQAVWRKTR